MVLFEFLPIPRNNPDFKIICFLNNNINVKNFKDYGHPNEFIYEWTYKQLAYEQLLTLDAGEGEKIPTLE